MTEEAFMNDLRNELKDGAEIVWTWVPTEEERLHIDSRWRFNDLAKEYAVVKDPKAHFGIIVYAKHHGKWEANPPSTRAVVAKMLAESGKANSF